jgi:hypothetical protein
VRRAAREATAADALARLLNQPGRECADASIRQLAPLPPVSVFIDASMRHREHAAPTLPMTSPAGVGLAKSRYRPRLAFGSYNANRNTRCRPNPIGAVLVCDTPCCRISIVRSRSMRRASRSAAADAAAQARKDVANEIVRA